VRIQIALQANTFSLPIHYGHIVQGLIYSQLEPNLAAWLHGDAYTFAQRTYKMFTFSRLEGEFKLEPDHKPLDSNSGQRRITFTDSVSFQLASHNTEILASFAEHLLKSQSLRLGQNECTVRGVEILKQPEIDFDKPIRVRMLSPLTVYSTLSHPDGRKKTYYYSPQEKEFSEMVRDNLVRKAKALGWEDDAEKTLSEMTFKPLRVNNKDQKILSYKGFMMKAWTGVYEIGNLSATYFWLAYDVGVGSKNSQGMGMLEVVR
jgi:CRISPR-associated endoribonuclease Cas6